MPANRFLKRILLASPIFLIVFMVACKKNVTRTDNITQKTVYLLDTTNLYSSASSKTKLKTDQQFYSILYNDLYQKSIPGTMLTEISILTQSIGDKKLAKQMISAYLLNDPNVILPTDAQMRADIPKFVEQAYIRFLQRKPTQPEKFYFKSLISADPKLLPEMVYYSLALSEEYKHY